MNEKEPVLEQVELLVNNELINNNTIMILQKGGWVGTMIPATGAIYVCRYLTKPVIGQPIPDLVSHIVEVTDPTDQQQIEDAINEALAQHGWVALGAFGNEEEE